MPIQVVMTSLFALAMTMALMLAGLPPLAYTIPARLAVFTGEGPGFGGHAGRPVGGTETLAGLRPL